MSHRWGKNCFLEQRGTKMHCCACKEHTCRYLVGWWKRGPRSTVGFFRKKSKVPWKACPEMAWWCVGLICLAWSDLEILHHNQLDSIVSLSKISPSQKTLGTERPGLWLFCVFRSQVAPAGLHGSLQLNKEVMKSIYALVKCIDEGWSRVGLMTWVPKPVSIVSVESSTYPMHIVVTVIFWKWLLTHSSHKTRISAKSKDCA